MPRIVLYVGPGCLLCAEASVPLARLARREGCEYAELDIHSDEELTRRYLLEIPVVTVDGVEVCRGRFDLDAVRRGIRAARASSPGAP